MTILKKQISAKVYRYTKTNFFSNVLSLSLVQFANYILPMIIVPYLVRILGTDLYGKVIYAQIWISYFTIIINFGLEYTATKEIAINKNNKAAVSRIFFSVLYLRAILFAISSTLFILLFAFSEKQQNDYLLYTYSFLINLGIVLFPNWYFQGVEKMKLMSIINFGIKLVSTILIIAFVKTSDNYLYIPFISFVVQTTFGIWSIVYILKNENLHNFIKPNWLIIKNQLSKGFPIFLSSVAISSYTIANFSILGLFCSDKILGLYSGAYKIIMAILMMISVPINTSLFPLLSRKINESKEEGVKLLKKSILIVGLLTLFISLILYLMAPLMVEVILGIEFIESTLYLRVFSLQPFLVTIASMLTVQGLYNFGLHKFSPFVGLFLGIFCFIFNYSLIPFYGGIVSAYAWVIAQLLEIIIVFSLLYFKNIKLI